MQHLSLSRRMFIIFNYLFLFLSSLVCLLPVINLIAISFSSSYAIESGLVKFWPVGFTTLAYDFVLKKPEFMQSMMVSIQRTVLGLAVNMFLTVLTAYPLSKNKSSFSARNIYANILLISMLFSGGLVPIYFIVNATGLTDTIWALILPGAIQAYNIILLQNFYRNIPYELEEAAFIDGAGYWRTLWQIYVPLSKPAIATLALFMTVGHWNAWFDGLIYMNRAENYPLQSYLQTVVINTDITSNKTTQEILEMIEVNSRNGRAAQIFIAMVPILCVYPFLQKYFTKGIVLGSVKG